MADAKVMVISFYECEHEGDLDGYIADLHAAGAKILGSRVDSEAETGEVKISVTDEKQFVEKFKKTESVGFSNVR